MICSGAQWLIKGYINKKTAYSVWGQVAAKRTKRSERLARFYLLHKIVINLILASKNKPF
jgi:hypothetical protein